MKLNTRNVTKKSGMTLLELTVVILVLLSLISILFIGARAWKKGSDRAGCIMNIRNVQQAVRGHQNMMNLSVDDTLLSTALVGKDGYLGNDPKCPAGTLGYTYKTKVPALGTVYAQCKEFGGKSDGAAVDASDPSTQKSTQEHYPTGNLADW
jgi:prepilin-type N-terminal cleavage/methylation domain-containing protein